MATISTLKVEITADTKGLDQGINSAKKSIDEVGKSADQAGTKSQNLTQKFQAMKPELLAMAGVASAVAVAVFSMVKEFASAEISMLRLEKAAELAGVKDGAEEINELAKATQKATGASADLVVQLGAELLAQGKSLEQTKKIIEAATALSAVTGESLSSSVQQLNDTYAGMTRTLGKTNPEIKALTQEQLKNGEAVDIILAKYGQFSDELSGSTDVAIKRVTENLGDLAEFAGSVAAPAFTTLANAFSEIIEGSLGAIDNFIKVHVEWATALRSIVDETFRNQIANEKLQEVTKRGDTLLRKYIDTQREATVEERALTRTRLENAIIQAKGNTVLVSGLKASLAQMQALEVSYAAEKRIAEQKAIDDKIASEKAFRDKQKTLLNNGIIDQEEYYKSILEFEKKASDELIKSDKELTTTQLAELKKRGLAITQIETSIKKITEAEKKSTEEVVKGEDKKVDAVQETNKEVKQQSIDYDKVSKVAKTSSDVIVKALSLVGKEADEVALTIADGIGGALMATGEPTTMAVGAILSGLAAIGDAIGDMFDGIDQAAEARKLKSMEIESQILDNKITIEEEKLRVALDAIDEETKAQLAKLGIIEETEIEKAEKKLKLAKESGDLEAIALAEKELKKEQIIAEGEAKRLKAQEEFDKAKAKLEHDKAVLDQKITIAKLKIEKDKAYAEVGFFGSDSDRRKVKKMYDELIDSVASLPIPAYARGTDYHSGGPALVGENGPEIVNLPTGASVTPATRTMNGGGSGMTVNIYSPMAVTPSEANAIFKQTARELSFSGVL